MKRYFYSLIILTAAFAYSCKSIKTYTPEFIGDNSATSLDWEGYYAGVVPCADCPGIQTSLVLNRDKTYTLTTTYLGEENTTFTGSGSFEWDAQGSSILLEGIENGPSRYLVGENRLFQLDMEGNRITGSLADHYILEKVDRSALMELASKKWRLIEIMGKPVEPKSGEGNDVFMTFDADENRVTGFGGCNHFFGQFEWEGELRVRFSKMGRTQKFCAETMELENEFFELIETVDNYTVHEDVLSLNRARMAPLLRFEAMEE